MVQRTVLVVYVLVRQGEGKQCEISRAKLNPTLYHIETCPADCCSELSYKFCCEAPDELNETVLIVFCVIATVVIIATIVGVFCCFKYEKKDKLSAEKKKSKTKYKGGDIEDQYGDLPRHHGHANPGYA
ncbi:uncharacterized protein [Argopecten irradians]|uniref:uncharacterized protein isoform X2 n=1 Tax=Argopecten irradians TaxID=31199 RepID=UPI0037186B29